LQDKYDLPILTLASYFDRDPRAVRKHLDKARKANPRQRTRLNESKAATYEDEIKSGEDTTTRGLSSIQQRKADLDQRHIDRTINAVNRIRNCLDDPHLEMEAWHGVDPRLLLGSHDWALVPEDWVSLTTPDFSDEALWGDELQQLKQHLEPSPFWEHLEELKQAAKELKEGLRETAQQVGEQSPNFKRAWEDFLSSCDHTLRYTRTPKFPEPDWDTIIHPCSDRFTEKVCKVLADGPMPGIYDRLRDLKMKLDQLNKDLAPDAIEPLIINSTCDYCKNSS
ncbi:hypothetical protein ACFLU3_04525, partial [Chloroflexota bacterium]